MDNQQRLEMYVHVLEHERHIEYRAFTTLGNYLTGNAFMVAAWATLYVRSSKAGFGGIDWVLVLISVAGYLGGLAWALLGARNWEYARRLVAELVKCGRGLEVTGDRSNLFLVLSGVEKDVREGWPKDSIWIRLSAHPTLLAWIPATLALLFVAMLEVLLLSKVPEAYGPACWFLGLLALGFVAGVLEWCQKRGDAAEDEVRKAKGSKTEPGGR